MAVNPDETYAAAVASHSDSCVIPSIPLPMPPLYDWTLMSPVYYLSDIRNRIFELSTVVTEEILSLKHEVRLLHDALRELPAAACPASPTPVKSSWTDIMDAEKNAALGVCSEEENPDARLSWSEDRDNDVISVPFPWGERDVTLPQSLPWVRTAKDKVALDPQGNPDHYTLARSVVEHMLQTRGNVAIDEIAQRLERTGEITMLSRARSRADFMGGISVVLMWLASISAVTSVDNGARWRLKLSHSNEIAQHMRMGRASAQ